MKTGDLRISGGLPGTAAASAPGATTPPRTTSATNADAQPQVRRRRNMLDGVRTTYGVQALGFGSKSSRGMSTVELPRTRQQRRAEPTRPVWRDLPKTSKTTFSGQFAQAVTTGTPTVSGVSAAVDNCDLAMRSVEGSDAHLQELFGSLDQPHVAELRTALHAYSHLVPGRPFQQVAYLAEALWLAGGGEASMALDVLQVLPHLDLAHRPARLDSAPQWRAAMALAASPDGLDCFLHLKGLVDHRQLNGELPPGRAFAALPRNGFDPGNTVACETLMWRTTLTAMAQVEREPQGGSPTLAARCLQHVSRLVPALQAIRETLHANEQERIDALIDAAGGGAAYADLRAYADNLRADSAVRKAGKWLKEFAAWLQRCEKADKHTAWNWSGPVRNAAIGSSPLYSLVKMGDGGFSMKHSGQEMQDIHTELVLSACDLLRMQLDLNISLPGTVTPPGQALERVALTTVLQTAVALVDPAGHAQDRRAVMMHLDAAGLEGGDTPRFLAEFDATWLGSDVAQPCLDGMCAAAMEKLDALQIEMTPEAVRHALLNACQHLTPSGLAAASAALPVVRDEMLSANERLGRLDIINGSRKFMPVVSLQALGEHVRGRLAILAAMEKGNLRPESGTIEDVSNYFVRAMKWHQDNSMSADDGVRAGIENLLIPVPLPSGAILNIRPTLAGEQSASFGINADNDGTRINIGVAKGVNGALGATGGYGWDFLDKNLKAGVFGDVAVGGNFRMKRGVTLLMRRDYTLAENAETPTSKIVNRSYGGMDTGAHRALSMSFFRFAEELARNPKRLASEAIVAARRQGVPEDQQQQIRTPAQDRLNPFGAGELTRGERKAMRARGRERDLEQMSGKDILQAFYLDENFRYLANQVGISLSSRREHALDITFGITGRAQAGSANVPGTRENDSGERKESLYGNVNINLVQGRLRLFDKSVRKDVGSGAFKQTVKSTTKSVTSGASLSASLPSPFGNKRVSEGKPSGAVDASAQVTWYEDQQSDMIRLHEHADGRLDTFNCYRGTNDTRFADFRARVERYRPALSALVGGNDGLNHMLHQIRERFPGGDVAHLIRWRLDQQAGRNADALRGLHGLKGMRREVLETRLKTLGGPAGRNLGVADLRERKSMLHTAIQTVKQSMARLEEKRAAVLCAEENYEPYGIGVNELKQKEKPSGLRYMALLAARKAVSGARETDWASSAAREGTHQENQRTRIAAAETRLLEQLREQGDTGSYCRAVDAMLHRGSHQAAGQALDDFRQCAGDADPGTQASLMQTMRTLVHEALAGSAIPAGWSAATRAWLAGDAS